VADGLIAGGRIYPVPNALVLGPGEADWLAIQGRDGRLRTPAEKLGIQMVTVHTTAGKDPHKIVDRNVSLEAAIARMRAVADFWRVSARGREQSGAAHLIIHDTFIAQLVDLVAFLAHHAGNNAINARSIGIEMVQEQDGTILSSTIDTCVRVCVLLADVLGIPLQTTDRVYRSNVVHRRLRRGGADVVGFFGHRDNSWFEPNWFDVYYPPDVAAAKRRAYPDGYADRDRGDPGDEWYARLRKAGAMAFDIDNARDRAWWVRVQVAMNQTFGTKLPEDGLCGPLTVAAMRKHGVWHRGVFAEFPVP
jgi:hypothetical protein